MIRSILFLLCTSFLFPLSTYAQQYDVSGVRNLLNDFVKAWNTHDPKNIVSLWTDDGDFVDAWGKWGKTSSNVERIFKQTFSGDLGKTTMEQTIDSMRFFVPDFVFVDATSTLCGLSSSDKKPFLLEHHMVYLIQKKEGVWKIVSARFYALLAPLTKVK